MHYGWNDFAIDEDKPTIIPKSGKKERIGNRKVMSPLDVKKINMLYGCTKSLTRQASPSKWSLRNQGGRAPPAV
jgi:Astacin (Peptidase family M12A)